MFGPRKLLPKISSMVKTGDKMPLNRFAIERRGRTALQHTVQHALIRIMLHHQPLASSVRVDHKIPSLIEDQRFWFCHLDVLSGRGVEWVRVGAGILPGAGSNSLRNRVWVFLSKHGHEFHLLHEGLHFLTAHILEDGALAVRADDAAAPFAVARLDADRDERKQPGARERRRAGELRCGGRARRATCS